MLLALASPPAPAQTTGGTAGGTTVAAAAPTTAPVDPNALSVPDRLDRTPIGRRLTGNQALAIADRQAKVREARAESPRSTRRAFLKGGTRWQISYYDRTGKVEIAQVLIDDATGVVLESWNGPQVAWTMARGYPGAFGRAVNAPYVWIPLLVLFVVPFVRWRRPLSWRTLDLLVLCSLSVSLAFFNDANLDASVPLSALPLLYLLLRLLWVGWRRDASARGEPVHLALPVGVVAVATIFLVGFRVGLNLTDGNVIDVGYSGVIGADKLLGLDALYGTFPKDNPFGDTYGPLVYLAYVPWVALLGWSGSWDELPAAHAAAISFDLACVALMFVLGRRLAGREGGVAMAYAWASFPFTLFVLNSNANDALVAALVLGVLLLSARPAARGAMLALAGAAKFAPLALGPLLLRAEPQRTVRFALAFLATAAVALLPVWLQGDVGLFYDRTVGFQATRGAPFSVWGFYGWDTAQTVAQVAMVALACAVAFAPGRRDLVGLCALSAAVLVALQLTTTYWFYLYVVWFLPGAFAALLAPRARAPRSPPASPPTGRGARAAESPPRAVLAGDRG